MNGLNSVCPNDWQAAAIVIRHERGEMLPQRPQMAVWAQLPQQIATAMPRATGNQEDQPK